MVVKLDEDELIEHWTLVGDELGQVAGKRGATRLGFSLLLKFYARHGRFPRGRGELPDEAVAYVARQVGVPASDLGFYEWDGRTVEYHRAQVRKFLGFRECTVADAEKLAAWLAGEVCQSERRAERVREELLQRCRQEGIEQPAGQDEPDHRLGAAGGGEDAGGEGDRTDPGAGGRADERPHRRGWR